MVWWRRHRVLVATYQEKHAGDEPEFTVSERARLKELERENRELKMERDFQRGRRPSSRRNSRERKYAVHRWRRR